MLATSLLISALLAGNAGPFSAGDSLSIDSWHNPHRCGPVSLYAVCSAFRIKASISELEEACGFDGRGVSVAGIIAAAEGKGLRATAYHSSLRHLQRLSAPAIIDYPEGHFCVFFGWKNGKAVLYDPPQGRLEVSKEQLTADWGKHAVVFSHD